MASGITHLYVLPIIICIWFPVTFILTYIISVCLKDVSAIFPYISDTGTFSPESCIFGQLLNTGSILMGIVIYIRYILVQDIHLRYEGHDSVSTINKICLWLGIFSSFGVSVVGNFQETNLFIIHVIGAAMAFGLGTVYLVLQTILSFKMYPTIGVKYVNYIRLFLSSTCAIASTLTLIYGAISLYKFTGVDITKWTDKDGGYVEHLVSAITEWITAIFTMCFILSFATEFKRLTLFHPDIEVIDNNSKAAATRERNRY